jgi:hypothetical protein
MGNNFKAIETLYSGCRFRSRLEARWATFFNTLGIPWEYEKEGYEIEGIRYLPDFWLPEQDCFIEIKGQEPTEEERMKARLLSIYTQKCVNVFYGSIDIPEEFMRAKSLRYTPVSVWKYLESEHVGGPSTTRIDVPPHILSLLQTLYDHHLNLVSRYGEPYCIEPDDSRIYRPSPSKLEEHLTLQLSGLHRLRPTYEALEKEIQQVLSTEEGWTIEILYQEELWYEDEALWLECNNCGAFDIGWPTSWHDCDDPETQGEFVANTPKIIAAYTAARSARFEFGEKGR